MSLKLHAGIARTTLSKLSPRLSMETPFGALGQQKHTVDGSYHNDKHKHWRDV